MENALIFKFYSSRFGRWLLVLGIALSSAG